jgi:hypothetical protein
MGFGNASPHFAESSTSSTQKAPLQSRGRMNRVVELTLVNDWQEGRGIIPFSRSILEMWISIKVIDIPR